MSQRKPTILIHVDDRRRDALVCVVLAKLLNFLGNRVLLCNRATHRLYWSQLQPDVLVTPYVWTGVSNPEELARRAERTRMIVFPTEGMVTTGEEWVRDYARVPDPNIPLDADTRRRYTRHLTKALLWGPAAKSALVEGGALDESQVAIIGWPRLDFFHPEAFRNGPNPASSPSGAGFVGGFPPINQFDHRSVFATIDGLRVAQARGSVYDADGNLEDLFWWYYAGARLFMDLLDEWILRRGGVAYYRPHPFEHFGSYNYLKKKYGKEFVLDGPLNPFPLWLASVSALVINRNSSTILPALFTGKPVITLQQMINTPFAKFTVTSRQVV